MGVATNFMKSLRGEQLQDHIRELSS